MARPAGAARVSRSIAHTSEVPGDWFDNDPAALALLISERCAPPGRWIVIPADFAAHRFLACHHSRLAGIATIPLPHPEVLESLDDKAWLADMAKAARIPIPHTIILRSPEMPTRMPVPPPVITKPARGSAGSGIRLSHTLDELRAAIAQAEPSPDRPLIVQEYVAGPDLGVSLLAKEGRIVASSVQRHLPGKRLRFEHNAAATRIAAALVAAVDYTGVAHIDLLERPDGRPVLLECNPRFWASLAAARHAGMNFVDLAMRAAANEWPAGPVEPPAGDCGRSHAEWFSLLRGALPSPATRAFLHQINTDPLVFIHSKLAHLSRKVGRLRRTSA